MSNNQIRGCRTSAIELAARCPFACQKIYRDGTKGGNNHLALLGSAIHNVLEEYGQHCLDNRVSTDYDFYDSIIDRHAVALPEEVQPDCYDVLEKLRGRLNFDTALQADRVFIERRFFFDKDFNVLPDDWSGEFHFTSAIDIYFIVGNVAYIFDYKSSRAIFTPTVIEHKLQKDFYAFMVMADHPEVTETVFYYDFIRYGTMSKPTHATREQDFVRLRNKLAAACVNYYTLMDPALPDEPARPSGFCGLCEVRGICPEVNNAICDLANIVSGADAVIAARKLKALQLATKQVQESLKEWVNAHGNIPISITEQFGVQAGEKKEIDQKFELLTALKEQNVPRGAMADLITMPVGKMEKFIKKNAPSIDLTKFVTKRGTTSYKYMDVEYDQGESSEADGE